MARKAPPKRPVTFSGSTLRARQEHRKDEPAFSRAWRELDTLGDTFDGLVSLYSTTDPQRTLEAHALAYKSRLEKAQARVLAQAESALVELDDLRQRRRSDAEIRAGLHSPLSDAAAAEIRGALRAMSPAERDKAIRSAALQGDASIIRAVRDAPTKLLVGHYTVPLDELAHSMANQVDPGLAELESDIDFTSNMVAGAVRRFGKLTSGMRDPEAESRAEQQTAAIASADRALDQP